MTPSRDQLREAVSAAAGAHHEYEQGCSRRPARRPVVRILRRLRPGPTWGLRFPERAGGLARGGAGDRRLGRAGSRICPLQAGVIRAAASLVPVEPSKSWGAIRIGFPLSRVIGKSSPVPRAVIRISSGLGGGPPVIGFTGCPAGGRAVSPVAYRARRPYHRNRGAVPHSKDRSVC